MSTYHYADRAIALREREREREETSKRFADSGKYSYRQIPLSSYTLLLGKKKKNACVSVLVALKADSNTERNVYISLLITTCAQSPVGVG